MTIVSIIFALHICLFAVKIWATYHIAKKFVFAKAPRGNTYMLIFDYRKLLFLLFCLLFVGSEAYFLVVFFLDVDLWAYEILLAADNIVVTLIATAYLIKEEKNGN